MFKILILSSAILSVAISDVLHLTHPYQFLDSPFLQNGYHYEPVQTLIPSSPPTLPEIIVNKQANSNGYNYDKPIIPPQSDEIIINNEYIPPSNNYIPPPQNDYLPPKFVDKIVENHKNGYSYPSPIPPQSDEIPPENDGYNYDPPKQPSNDYLPPSNHQGRVFKDSEPKSQHRLQLRELRCLSNSGGYFQGIINVQSFLANIPIVDTDVFDRRCNLAVVKTQIVINFGYEDFQRCGVVNCGSSELCLRLRFPQIRDMKSIGDAILTLQCKVQDKIVTKVHSIKVGVSDSSQKRSSGTHVQGGSQQNFRTQVSLYRKSGNENHTPLEPGGTVQLGEELFLRAHVNSGDGWNHTRISDVSLERQSPNGNVINTASIITANGCVNPSMRSICPQPPVFEPPLGHRLGFKAIMFQGMRSGDEIIMNVKVIGCMERGDCLIDCERNSDRFKRSLDQLSEISQISFRIEIPQAADELNHFNSNKSIAIIAAIGGFCLICLIALISVYLKNQRLFNKI